MAAPTTTSSWTKKLRLQLIKDGIVFNRSGVRLGDRSAKPTERTISACTPVRTARWSEGGGSTLLPETIRVVEFNRSFGCSLLDIGAKRTDGLSGLVVSVFNFKEKCV